jgi:hypothetical protein
MRAAAALVKPDASAHAWTLNTETAAKHPDAYPGTMAVYADVPTSGLDKADATRLATLLHYAATTGQQPGIANGQLPAGYLPLSKANGLADLSDYTSRAGQAVAAQDGTVPALRAPATPPPTSSTSAPRPSHRGPHPTMPGQGVPGGGPVPSAPAPQGAGAGRSSGSAPLPSTVASGPSTTATSSPGQVAVRSVAAYSRLGSLVLPIALALGLLCGLVGSALRYRPELRTVLVQARRIVRRGAPGRRRR